MAKVDFNGEASFFNPAAYANVKVEAKKTKDKAPVGGVKKLKFSNILEHALEKTESTTALSESGDTVRELLDDVHSAGDALKNHPFPEEIKRYKQAVKNFLRYIVENGYTVTESSSGVNLLKRKKYTTVQVVDQKLEQLAVGILAGQIAQLELLSRIEEIAGLLVDLLQ
ncbi:MAG: DUF327 family protein [Treponema sp.]|jgi:uncharacterized protein YaaR (DUF327 family)|nr:DUF327 family protein [Treponema sp.]